MMNVREVPDSRLRRHCGRQKGPEKMRLRLGTFALAILHALSRSRGKAILLACFLLPATTVVHADGDDMDNYKWRLAGYWWFSQPTGVFFGAGNSGRFDLQRDFGFGRYSTFTGYVDWRFKRKHHLLFDVSPVDLSRSAILARTITFQGVTYNAGALVSANLHSFLFVPGYQWDFIRRDHGFVALGTQLYIFDTKATLSETVSVNGQGLTRTASGSVFVPLPTIGLRTRWYPFPHSGRLDLEGNAQGMYFFGYGDFAAGRGNADVEIVPHLKVSAGYQMGSRLNIHGGSDQIGVRLRQEGPVAGVVGYW
jgi:hypothetical protein